MAGTIMHLVLPVACMIHKAPRSLSIYHVDEGFITSTNHRSETYVIAGID